uniref:Gypsy retrotransposon integrase-like protein 1 n=1 Tax=Xiphophorus maculatus TaxID=8083 RepID=A0A3B5QLU2_XIPMA
MSVEDFNKNPSAEFLDLCSREQLVKIAEHFKISVGDKRLKENVKAILRENLIEMGVLSLPSMPEDLDLEVVKPKFLDFEQQKEMLRLRMQLEKEKELALETLRQQADLDKVLALEKLRQETELARIHLESEKLNLMKDGKLFAESCVMDSKCKASDILSDLRLVPKFSEKDVETFFTLFERVAETRDWSDSDRIVLLQCVLVGRAQEAFSMLSLADGQDYAKVKATILKAYELVPEAYRQKFRNWKKGDKTYVEFARDLEIHFNRWCTSSEVRTLGDLCNLMVLEQFKNSVSQCIAVYINEQKVKTVSEAAVLADDFVLTHKDTGGEYTDGMSAPNWRSTRSGGFFSNHSNRDLDKICNYCHRKGHWKKDCALLKSRNKNGNQVKPAALAASVLNVSNKMTEVPFAGKPDLSSYKPFLMEGEVSLIGSDVRVPVTILRDTGAYDSFILASVLSFSDESDTGLSIPVLGMGMSVFCVPVHKLVLHSELFEGEVRMGVRPALPVVGVTVILGNHIAGGKVWPDQPEYPVIVSIPLVSSGPDENEKSHPEVFQACAVTRAMKASSAVHQDESFGKDTQTSSFCWSNIPLSISQNDLGQEQRSDPTIQHLFQSALPAEEMQNHAHGYFVENKVLLRKWMPCGDDVIGQPVYQVVVPLKLRDLVLQVSHDESGHMGVRKTYDRILRNFFWPRLKKDIASYIKTCHTCQLTGKPNQVIHRAPLYPIPTIGKPFEHLIIDCVGPLPPSRLGAKYLLTVMCQSTRYPAAYPLHTLTAKSVVRALGQFIGIFGIPKVIQSDQGSNFSSHLFAQVLKQLHIQHNQSTAYHAQSQGALERFHQTLKSLLRAYCVQMKADWEDGLPWLLLAAREVTQESTGFSPNELVFGHTVRGPLTVLRDEWKDAEPPQNLLHYVNGFRQRLFTATQLANRKLSSAQEKMKCLYDKKAEHRVFLSGDQVLALLPVVTSPFQAKFSGPHTVLKQLSDQNYLIATPERRKKQQTVHVNLLKPYHVRDNTVLVDDIHPVCISETVTSAGGEWNGDGLPVPDSAMLTGRLINSEVLKNLDTMLNYLPETQCFELVQLIKSYSDLFADIPSCTHLIEHDIEVGDAQPIKQQFYRVSPEKRKYLDAEIDYMLKNGIAQASCSSWSSPCLLVPKSDKTYRFCSDFRKVNSITKTDSYPLPRMDDCIDQIGNAKFISKIDLLKGYWQVPLTKRAQEIAAFITPTGLYSYNVMPFGLKNAPATFQRLMNKVVGCLEGCSVYLDDIVVYSNSWSSHLEQLTTLFDRLVDARLTVNLAKCEFARATVIYLGHQVGQGKVCPVKAKVEAIEKYPPPTTKKELMKFLGLVGYYRAFCRNFSTVVAPLTDLLKSNVKYIWSSVCQQAFEDVKRMLCDSPVLLAPDMNKSFKLQVDASHVGAGGVLLQMDVFSIERPVSFFSRKFNRHQLNYSVIEKETLALIWSLQHFEVYVGSGPLTVFTDHNPLTFLNSFRCPNQRLVRWSLFLQSFSLDIRHIKGKDNVIADALSRAQSQ